MTDFALKFADSTDQYTFTNVSVFDWDFSTMQTMVANLPGAHGGYDQHHADEDRARVGTVKVEFTIEADDSDAMQYYLDQVTKLPYLGRQKLYYQPQGNYTERWCRARVKSLDMGLAADMSLHVQKVKLTFEVPDPCWRHTEESQAIAASGTSTTATITNTGNAVALAKVVFSCAAGQTAEDPTVQRIVSGVAVDEMKWTGTMIAGDSVTMDATAKSCLDGSTGDYANFSFTHPDWFRLLPGANAIKVVMTNVGDAATVTVYWSDTFR